MFVNSDLKIQICFMKQKVKFVDDPIKLSLWILGIPKSEFVFF